MSQVFTVDFTPPRAGWLQLAMRSGEAEWRVLVSHTPFDSLEEFASVMARFVEEGTPGTARFNSEPEEHHLFFEPGPRPGALRLRAVVFPRGRRASSPELVWTHEGDGAQIARTLWRAFRRLESQFSAEHWVHPFPSRFVASLASMR